MATATWLVIASSAVAMVAAGYTRNRVPVAVSVAIAAVLRVAFAIMTSKQYTPHDVLDYFHRTAVAVLHGQDPLNVLPGREWNFLELMPYIHAAELKTGLPWEYAVKIAPIIADLVLVWIVSRLAGSNGRTRALQYAVNPLSLLVVSLHGQVEPVALALALGGILLLKSERPMAGGVLIGAAVAAITWPVLILLAVLPLRQPRRAGKVLLGSTFVPVGCLLSGVLFLHLDLIHAIKRILTYSGYVKEWTWSGALVAMGDKVNGYNSPLGGLSFALVIIGVGITLWLLRRHPPEVRALGVLCAVLICSAGFGVQYLLWVLPLTIALVDRWRNQYVLAATAWAAIFYLTPFGTDGTKFYLMGLSWLPALAMVAIIGELRRLPYQVAAGGEVPATEAPAEAPRPDLVAVASGGVAASGRVTDAEPVSAGFPVAAGHRDEDVSAAS